MSLSEADTRAKLIDPALRLRGWTEDMIKREESAGMIEILENGQPRRRSNRRVDYVLRYKMRRDTQPVAMAIIEAKAESKPANHGLEQARCYGDCKRLNVPFIYSTNGHQFVEFDRLTGKTSDPLPLTQFPTPAELRQRWEAHVGFSLDDDAARPLLARYLRGETDRRYYQDAAVRAVFEKIARAARTGEPPRALLSLATGTGKTRIAGYILQRIAEAGQLERALFVCDRDELREQGFSAMFAVFGNDAAMVYRKSDGSNNAANAKVHVATYQTLGVATDDGDAKLLTEFYPDNYFSHIIIDECHRSAWGKWSEILRRNPKAVQIGLTATPRQLTTTEDSDEARRDQQITADNYAWFGEPVYEYDMAQGIEDGYLAACMVHKGRVDLDDTGITIDEIMARGPVDANTGQPLSRDQLQAMYEKTEFEDRLLLPDRVMAMTRDLFDYLLQTGGPEQKTIIFCARDRHAQDVAIAMNNLYADWCKANGVDRAEPYAFKCTAQSSGNDFLPEFRGASRSHFIATTVDLLTTGVDVPVARNIVFFKYVRSPIAFYQMVGRGTRLDPATGKLMFRVYDYTDATRLFGEEFKTTPPRTGGGGGGGGGGDPPPPTVLVQGFDVIVSPAGKLIVTNVDGKAMPVTVEEYRARLAASVLEQAANIDEFRARWVVPAARRELMAHLPDGGRSALLIREIDSMEPYDLYDVLASLAYGMNPLSRVYRAGAFNYKHADWLAAMPEDGRRVVTALVNQFAMAGTDGLENREVFKTPEVVKAGGLLALRKVGEPSEVLRETKDRIFAA